MVDSSKKVPIFWIESSDRHSHKITRHKDQTFLYADPRKETGSEESWLSGSQHLLLDLKAGGTVSVWQQAEPMESVKDVSFCVSLINLDQTNFQNLSQIEINQTMTSTDFNINSLVKTLNDFAEKEVQQDFNASVIDDPKQPRSSLAKGCTLDNMEKKETEKCSLTKRERTEKEEWYNPKSDLKKHNCTLSLDATFAKKTQTTTATPAYENRPIDDVIARTNQLETFETFVKFR